MPRRGPNYDGIGFRRFLRKQFFFEKKKSFPPYTAGGLTLPKYENILGT
jgi:hypothetical protein